jgi:hypothetical protein
MAKLSDPKCMKHLQLVVRLASLTVIPTYQQSLSLATIRTTLRRRFLTVLRQLVLNYLLFPLTGLAGLTKCLPHVTSRCLIW